MPDITMCKGKKCTLKEKCYRYKAKPSIMQSWFTKEPCIIKGEKCKCEYFYEKNINI